MAEQRLERGRRRRRARVVPGLGQRVGDPVAGCRRRAARRRPSPSRRGSGSASGRARGSAGSRARGPGASRLPLGRAHGDESRRAARRSAPRAAAVPTRDTSRSKSSVACAQGPRTPRQALRMTSAYRASHVRGWRATVAQGPFGAGPRAKAMSASRSSAGSSAIRSSSANSSASVRPWRGITLAGRKAPRPNRERAQGGEVARLELGAHAGEPVAREPRAARRPRRRRARTEDGAGPSATRTGRRSSSPRSSRAQPSITSSTSPPRSFARRVCFSPSTATSSRRPQAALTQARVRGPPAGG